MGSTLGLQGKAVPCQTHTMTVIALPSPLSLLPTPPLPRLLELCSQPIADPPITRTRLVFTGLPAPCPVVSYFHLEHLSEASSQLGPQLQPCLGWLSALCVGLFPRALYNCSLAAFLSLALPGCMCVSSPMGLQSLPKPDPCATVPGPPLVPIVQHSLTKLESPPHKSPAH